MKKNQILFIVLLVMLCGCGASNEWNEELAKSSSTSEHSLYTKPSPNLTNQIELREYSKRIVDKKDKKIMYRTKSLRIYTGDYGEELVKTKEIEGFTVSTVDYFKIEWQNETTALVRVFRVSEEGGRFEDESIRINVEATLKKQEN